MEWNLILGFNDHVMSWSAYHALHILYLGVLILRFHPKISVARLRGVIYKYVVSHPIAPYSSYLYKWAGPHIGEYMQWFDHNFYLCIGWLCVHLELCGLCRTLQSRHFTFIAHLTPRIRLYFTREVKMDGISISLHAIKKPSTEEAQECVY